MPPKPGRECLVNIYRVTANIPGKQASTGYASEKMRLEKNNFLSTNVSSWPAVKLPREAYLKVTPSTKAAILDI